MYVYMKLLFLQIMNPGFVHLIASTLSLLWGNLSCCYSVHKFYSSCVCFNANCVPVII
jgi:hypothetical protein